MSTRNTIRGLRLLTICNKSRASARVVPSKTNQQVVLKRNYSPTTMTSQQHPATADLCDKYVNSPSRLMVATPGYFKDFGGIKKFSGKIETVKCFESNPAVRTTLGEDGQGRVLVVDGAASQRVALCGDMLAQMAADNGWSGLIINGCIRDSAVIAKIPVGVKAMNTHPLKSAKTHPGERGCTVAFAGVEFVPGMYVYADEDGVIVGETELTVD